MNLDTRGFMDGAFRGFQMMESYYDRQDRKEARADSLRRADERLRVDDERYNSEVERRNERQQVEDQRYADNLKREEERHAENIAWREKVHRDNKALQGLRYATRGSNSGFGKEYRGAVTKLMTWKRDSLAKIDPLLTGDDRKGAIASIDEQYKAGMDDINSLYGLSSAPQAGGDVDPKSKDEAPYISWTAKDPNRAGFINALKRAKIDVSSIPADKLTLMFNDNAAKKAESEAALARKAQFDSDADKILGLNSVDGELAINAYRAR